MTQALRFWILVLDLYCLDFVIWISDFTPARDDLDIET